MQNSKPLPRYSFYLPPRLVVKYKNPFIHGSMVIKKEILNMMGNYNEKYFYSQDYYLFKRLTQNNAKIKHIKEQLYMLNTKNNISSNFQKEQNYYAQCIQKNIEPDKDRK